MKVLLITGQLAAEAVATYAKQSQIETEVIALQTAVAAFLTPQTIIDGLKDQNLSRFNIILTPGLLRGNTAVITKAIGISAFKGPRYAADLPVVLDMLCEVELSTTTPADELLQQKLTKKALAELEKVENQRDILLKNPGNMIVGDVAVGKDFPLRVLAEIVDAALMDKTTIQQTARRFALAGADFIDVGMVTGESQPEKAAQMVHWVREVTDLPVSIDSLNPEEIKAAVKAGAQLVLSADAGNLKAIAPYIKDVVVVVIPTNQSIGYIPKKASERIPFLEETIATARSLGVNRILADLILDPQEILNSFFAFKEFAQRNPEVPLFIGISNVTELFDADSVGLNAVLTRLSAEIGGGILLATEKSIKAKGTVAEEVVASKMMFLAKKRGSVPKDLGIDLLILKDKRDHEEPYDRTLESTAKSVIIAPEKVAPATLDHLGAFRIFIDHTDRMLVAIHYSANNQTKPANIIKGKTAQAVHAKILEMGIVSKLDHSAYLSNELTKAEIALRTNKNYLQDATLF
ncbi:MAG: dihydropteroate synthase-like protein [Nitrososphaerota archaeon]|jgi:dihydropteroate synthase-like protein|uniref:dihydropteroate synthase-like protein n=1 Tax=Candidatus Bathycorpusculum sp. TaxID=2994959 RepID=UPI0028303A56|nr:dihydropteroate synthase-like protein [Candidatus Termitimicrobium sp.]MCL2431045.1 dihydropteroate synthase-like protein [Candidatus Termitimicrobium sp.]MDR0493750.1 dihydropteroate synthase-like protein [Nitrososphaerota archaeon]